MDFRFQKALPAEMRGVFLTEFPPFAHKKGYYFARNGQNKP